MQQTARLTFSILLLVSFFANANVEQTMSKELLIEMSNTSAQQSCSDQPFLACMKISQSDCINVSNEIRTSCFETLPDTFSMNDALADNIDRCVNEVTKKLGIDITQSDACEDLTANDDDSSWDDISQSERIEKLGEQMRAATGTGTRLGEITLPLYQPHEITIHIADEAEMDGVKFLPVVSLKVKADKDTVLAFYLKKLPSFKQDPDDPYNLVEKLLPDNDNIYKYAQVPNVAIYSLDAENTLIQLYYRR